MSKGKEVAKVEEPAQQQVEVIEPQRVHRVQMLRPIAAPDEIIAAHAETTVLIQKALQKDRDYGVIPHTGDKPTLLKPGAEKIVLSFGCRAEFALDHCIEDPDRVVQWNKKSKDWYGPSNDRRWRWKESSGESRGHYEYRYTCRIVSRESGVVLGEGVGVCSTMESKYVDRPRDSQNTAAKMAQKRALVAATLLTFGLSDQFTQDVEEMRDQLEQARAAEAATEEQAPADNEAVWPYGRYGGTQVKDLKSNFLVWANDPGRDWGTFSDEWHKILRAEIIRRCTEAGLNTAEIDEVLAGRRVDKPAAKSVDEAVSAPLGEGAETPEAIEQKHRDNSDPESFKDMPDALDGVDDDLPF